MTVALRIAISVRDWPHMGAKGGMTAYFDAVAALIDDLVVHHGAEITFLSTCQGVGSYWTDDSATAETLVEHLDESVRGAVRIDREFHTPSQLVSMLGNFDAVIATRMHVAILALLAGTPVLPIAYEFKTVELFAKLGLDGLVQDIETITPEGLTAACDHFLSVQADVCSNVAGPGGPRASLGICRGRMCQRSFGGHIMTKPLRIAFFVHEFPALSETFVLNQACGLVELGHDVTIFAERPRAEPRIHPDVSRCGLIGRTRYLTMPRRKITRLLRAGKPFFRLLRNRPGTARGALSVPRFGRDAWSLRLLYWSARLMDEGPFDVIHCHFGPIGQLAAKLRDIGAFSGMLSTVFHGVDISAYVQGRPDYYRYLFERGDLFLPISENWRRRLVELGCNPGRIAVHHMGVESRRYRFRPRQFERGRALRLLTVGRMVDKKGVEYALRAVALLCRRGVPVQYALVGDGELRHALARLAGELGITEQVRFFGWQDQEAVSRHMARNDVLLVPSVTSEDGDQEGIPVTLMEAMASGMLVVATEHSGIPELVENGRSGILVPERDVEGLADALAAPDVAHEDVVGDESRRARACSGGFRDRDPEPFAGAPVSGAYPKDGSCGRRAAPFPSNRLSAPRRRPRVYLWFCPAKMVRGAGEDLGRSDVNRRGGRDET